MRVVTANGTIVDLSPGHATLHPKYQHEPVTQLSVHRYICTQILRRS